MFVTSLAVLSCSGQENASVSIPSIPISSEPSAQPQSTSSGSANTKPPPVIGDTVLPIASTGELTLPSKVYFRTNAADLLPESKAALQSVIDFLARHPEVTLLRVGSYVDRSGNDTELKQLAADRALETVRELVVMGVDCKRLLPISFWDERPLVCNDCTESGRAPTRRIAFSITSINGQAPFGPPDAGRVAVGDPCSVGGGW